MVFLSEPAVLTPLMLLWVNVIADGPPALTLGLEPARRAVIHEPPRPPGTHIPEALAWRLTRMPVALLGARPVLCLRDRTQAAAHAGDPGWVITAAARRPFPHRPP